MRIYIESTIPSYVVARPGRDLIQAANQQLTRDWWEFQLLEDRRPGSDEGAGRAQSPDSNDENNSGCVSSVTDSSRRSLQ